MSSGWATLLFFCDIKTLKRSSALSNKEARDLRNIGISAHIDSGKTTLTERILYYTHRIHAIHEVKGKDGSGATMDFMELERERGITITSAATYCEWKNHRINIIDTPGHVDFTIEVERALRVMDGGILILCAVGGVQSQTITVDRQMNRYKIPRIVFINKCDRAGADPYRVLDEIRQKLGYNAILLQLPIGLEDKLSGVVDLVRMKALYFKGSHGEKVIEEEIPSELKDESEKRREELLDAASMFSDELMEAIFDENVTEELIHSAIRRGCISRKLVPVLMGSAYKNIGVQPLLDAVTHYLPSPQEMENLAIELSDPEKQIPLSTNPDLPLVAFAFKLEVTPYGQLTYLRIYQGRIKKGDNIFISRTGQKIRVGRIVRMHADKMEDIEEAYAGDVVALFGVDCHTGDTFTDGKINCTMSSIFIPEPVISLTVLPSNKEAQVKMAKVVNRFAKEDPTFRVHVDEETGDTIISGMGELHLEIYVERMKREFGIELTTKDPEVAYRETITKRAYFDYTHKKQTGGAGQYGKVVGYIEPTQDRDYEFISQIKGGAIPSEFIPAVDEGFRECLKKGSLIGAPVQGIKVVITDGKSHSVDSSERAFHYAAIGAFRQAYTKAKPVILQPIMKVSVEAPSEFQGRIMASINQRKGIILSCTENSLYTTIEAEVPLKEMFGYATVLRSLTQGKGEFTMEFSRYERVPEGIAEELKKEKRRKTNGK